MKTKALELFLSTPISSFKLAELDEFTKLCFNLKYTLSRSYNCSIYCAALNIKSTQSFDDPTTSTKLDLEKISTCTGFILLYPKRLPTSALIELGFAIALKKPTLIITPDINELPFMAKGLPGATPNVRIETSTDFPGNVIDLVTDFVTYIKVDNNI